MMDYVDNVKNDRLNRHEIREWFTGSDAERYEDIPRILPNHGAQPRYPKQQRRHDPFDDGPHRLSRSEEQKTKIARLLAKAARDYHAPKLAWRPDNAIAAIIETEVLPDARFIVASLPHADHPRVLDKFIAVLWDQIASIRQQRRNKA